MPRRISDRPASAARKRPPRLVLLFAVFTALGVATAAAVILVVVRQTDTARAHGQAIDRARFAARAVLRPELRAADLSRAPSPERRRELDRLFQSRVLVEGMRGAALYGASGELTYATDARTSDPATLARVRDALGGSVVSLTATAVDGSRVLRTYVPVGDERGGIAGVVTLDERYEPIEAAVRRSSWLVAGVLELLLLLLFLVFVPVLARVSSRIRRQVDELEHVATHDDLTGLPNRLALDRAGEQLLARGELGALLLFDVDGFSEINDRLGWESGDVLLVEVAERIRRGVESEHLVARLGGDEFAVLLHGDVSSQVEETAERIRQAVAGTFAVDGVRLAVSTSVGAALLPEHGPAFGTVLRRAGASLTAAKSEGRADVHVYDPAYAKDDVASLAFAAELRDALDEGQLVVHYQPQADLTTQRIRAVEALLRWHHPEHGLLTADEFITCAERSGLARELRHFVLESVAEQWRRWQALDVELELAVNLSPVDMLDVSLPDEIEDLVERHGIPPWNLVLEITERTLVRDERRARHVVDRLHGIGVRLAIDDFGTGYSSLASLRTFPIQQVKLDRSLLAGVPGNPAAEAIVGGSVEIAHGVGATVVAEGIETREQWRFVFLMGCDIAQGWLVGRPAPADELALRLQQPSLGRLVAA